ncbi:MAG TPA: hypothetical protein VEC99_06125 [Clostridia bacterium]|nr:hypothetical protein [Clostridia bacterium]
MLLHVFMHELGHHYNHIHQKHLNSTFSYPSRKPGIVIAYGGRLAGVLLILWEVRRGNRAGACDFPDWMSFVGGRYAAIHAAGAGSVVVR